MFHDKIKSFFSSAVDKTVSSISEYAVNPGRDFSRSRKLPPDRLITFLVSEGAGTTKNELLDFFGLDPEKPTSSALNQQRAKLKPEAVEAVFKEFNSSIDSLDLLEAYRFLAVDGSTVSYPSGPSFSPSEYFSSPGSSSKGCYSMHINAFYDLDRHIYTDALIQPVRLKDEFRAFCSPADRHPVLPGTRNVYIGGRGYCSYNNMAHVIENGQYFVFRAKDILSKGMLCNFKFPEKDSFDVSVNVVLVRSHSRKIRIKPGCYRRFVDKAASFDFIEYSSYDTYELSFRVVRFSISDNSCECIVTNLPKEEFPPGRLKKLYFLRWGIESSFRKLKYTIGLNSFHSCKPQYIRQEIWARLITYNITEVLACHAAIRHQKETKYTYKVNFSTAAHICRCFLRPAAEKTSVPIMSLLEQELIPVRDERQYPRLKTAHFRKPRYFIYRAS